MNDVDVANKNKHFQIKIVTLNSDDQMHHFISQVYLVGSKTMSKPKALTRKHMICIDPRNFKTF